MQNFLRQTQDKEMHVLFKLLCYGSISFILFGCMLPIPRLGANELDDNTNKFCHKFFNKYDSDEQEKQFQNYNIDEQYVLLIYGNQAVHPPVMWLITEFAKQGEIIVPFIRVKLENTNNELTIRDIIYTFEELARLKLYDFSKDPRLMELIEKRANGMKSPWKDIVCNMVSRIKNKNCYGQPATQDNPNQP